MRFRKLSMLIRAAAVASFAATLHAEPVGTAFTYQGQLKDGGVPVNNTCDFAFRLWDAESGPAQVGPTLTFDGAGGNPAPISVANGLFTAVLDFGSLFDGDARWLEISTRCPAAVGSYATLIPRQELSPGPYALFAMNGADGGGNTLDQAYDEGGSGSGRTITADGGPVNVAGRDGLTVNGRVGIGTLTPTHKLEIASGGDSFKVGTANSWFSVSTGGNSRLSLGDGAGNEAGYILGGHNSPGDNIVKITSCNDAGSCPTGTTFRQNGNVGIGTTSPNAKLHVTGSTKPVILAETSSTSSSAFAIQGVVTSTAPGGYSSGVRGINNGTAGNGIGVYGSQNGSGWGVYGLATSGRGVYGNSTDGTGVYGYSMNGDGVRGASGSSTGWAGHFVSTNSNGGALYAQGSGAGRDKATLRVDNTEPAAGMAAYLTNDSTYATIHVQNDGTGETLWLENTGGGHLIVAKTDAQWRFWVDGAGITHVRVLQVHGGADLSEGFDVRGTQSDRDDLPSPPTAATPAPGMVVAIDPENPGKLAVASVSYDRKVAGIISGAGGVQPGMMMGQDGTEADGDYPVALTGRVHCRCVASNGPIKPGDLLTTSDIPGHAMKVTDYTKAQGAIIGKAMTSLETGEGLVLVLVSLQ